MRLVLLLILTLNFSGLKGQNDIATVFNSTHSGRNTALTYSKTHNSKNEFGVGLRYNMGMIAMPDDQNNYFLKRLYPTDFWQHIGLEGFYHKYILRSLEAIKPFAFYDLQVAYSTTFNRMYVPYTSDTDGSVLYKMYEEHFGPFTWIEQCIGVGFKAHISGQFHLIQKIGFGTSFILGKELLILKESFDCEFAGLIQVGLVYRLRE